MLTYLQDEAKYIDSLSFWSKMQKLNCQTLLQPLALITCAVWPLTHRGGHEVGVRSVMEGGENVLERFISFFSLLRKMWFPQRNNMLNKSWGPKPQKPTLTHIVADYIQYDLVHINKAVFFSYQKGEVGRL